MTANLCIQKADGFFACSTARSRSDRFSSAGTIKFGQSPFWNAQLYAPICQIKANTTNFDIDICACVFALNFYCGPNTVFRAIVAIVINALDRIATGRFFAHIGIKIFKRVLPPFTNLNSSTAVRMVFVVVRVITSALHVAPRFVFKALAQIMSKGVAIHPKQIGGSFTGEAPTAFRRFCKVGGRDNRPTAAVASACPHRIFVPWAYRSAAQYHETAESFTFQVQRNPIVCHV